MAKLAPGCTGYIVRVTLTSSVCPKVWAGVNLETKVKSAKTASECCSKYLTISPSCRESQTHQTYQWSSFTVVIISSNDFDTYIFGATVKDGNGNGNGK